MKKEDFFNLELGKYELTDNIDNYQFELTVKLTDNGQKMYVIYEKDSLPFSAHICLFEEFEDGEKYLFALSGVGSLCVHSTDTSLLLNEIKFVK